MSSEKVRYKASRVIGDRIKMDVLIFLRKPCRKVPEEVKKRILCDKFGDRASLITPSYTTLHECIKASSPIIIKKLNEMENDGLLFSIRKVEDHNKRFFVLTSLGERVADLLIELDDLLEEGLPEKDEEDVGELLINRLIPI